FKGAAGRDRDVLGHDVGRNLGPARSEEHTSELQSPVVTSYAVFCLKKKRPGRCRRRARRSRPLRPVLAPARFQPASGSPSFFHHPPSADIYPPTGTLALPDALPI